MCNYFFAVSEHETRYSGVKFEREHLLSSSKELLSFCLKKRGFFWFKHKINYPVFTGIYVYILVFCGNCNHERGSCRGQHTKCM